MLELDLVTHKRGKMQGQIDVPTTKLVRKLDNHIVDLCGAKHDEKDWM